MGSLGKISSDGLEFRTYAPAGDIRGTSGRITRVAESGEHFRLRLEELLPGDMLLLEHRPVDDGPWVASSAGMVLGLFRRPGGRVSRVDVVWFWRAGRGEQRPLGATQPQRGVAYTSPPSWPYAPPHWLHRP